MKCFFLNLVLYIMAIHARAGGPVLEGGLSLHFLPDRYDLHGGFVVMDSSTQHPCKTFQTAKDLFAYLQTQPKTEFLDIPRNGIWIYVNDPHYYSPSAKSEFNSLLALCKSKHIPTYVGLTIWRPALPNLGQKP